MALLKRIKDKSGMLHTLGDARIDALESELSGAEHNVPYSPAVLAKTNSIEESLSDHAGNMANPHNVTKEQLGLANVENKSSSQIRSEITKENVTGALGYVPIDENRIGAANGVASLDSSGRIPASQIPGGFDNIEEYDDVSGFPEQGEEGKIYVATDTNLTYRWTGTQYVEISPSLALGETATTAYRGDRGKTAYDHSQVVGDSTVHHVHKNKELLDGYTQTDADLANAVANAHEHGNKAVLDNITSAKVNSWDAKQDAFDVLPVSKGGTGATTKRAAEYNILGSEEIETAISDERKIALMNQTVSRDNGVFRWLKVSRVWDYVKGKISSVLGLTETSYSGKASTAGTADKAIADKDGNSIETTYATKTEIGAKQDRLIAGSGITIDGNTISALNRLAPVDISTDESKDFDNLPEDDILYYKNSSTDFANQPESGAMRFIQWTSANYYSVQVAVTNFNRMYVRHSTANQANNGKSWGEWVKYADSDDLSGKQDALTAGTNITIEGNTISSDQQFVADYGKTTYTEIKAAYEAGKICVCKNACGDILFVLSQIADGKESFDSWNDGDRVTAICTSDNKWSVTSQLYQSRLTFDTEPTPGSSNPVTSSGVFNYTGRKALFAYGSMASTDADNAILFYLPWHSASDSRIYNVRYEIKYVNYRGGKGGSLSITPNITKADGGNLNMVGEKESESVIKFATIEAPDGDVDHPYWLVGYGAGVGGTAEVCVRLLNNETAYFRTPSETILMSSCTVTKDFGTMRPTFTNTPSAPESGTFALESVDGVVKWGENFAKQTDLENKQDTLAAGDNITIENNVISSDQVFIASYGTTTHAEIKAAHEAGKICECRDADGTNVFHLKQVSDSFAGFSCMDDTDHIYIQVDASTNKWSIVNNQLQKKLTFDRNPILGSTNPVTSGGVRNMHPLYTRFDTETTSRLIMWCKFDSQNMVSDVVRKFGLKLGTVCELLYPGGNIVYDIDNTVILHVLNDGSVNTGATARLKASIFKDSSDAAYFALWLDGSVSQSVASYYCDYYPDVPETDWTSRHFTPFSPGDYTLVRNLDIKYVPKGVPYPSKGVLTSTGTSNGWVSTLSVGLGGTGASTAAGARANLLVPSVDDFNAHTGDSTVHVTETERVEWNAKQDALTAGNNVTIEGNTVSSDQMFVAVPNTTKYAAIKAAYEAGKICVCKPANGRVYSIVVLDESSCSFCYVNSESGSIDTYGCSSSDKWTLKSTSYQTKLTFDDSPKSGSSNPVRSDGIKNALDGVQSNIDTVNAKGIVVKEIDGDPTLCYE